MAPFLPLFLSYSTFQSIVIVTHTSLLSSLRKQVKEGFHLLYTKSISSKLSLTFSFVILCNLTTTSSMVCLGIVTSVTWVFLTGTEFMSQHSSTQSLLLSFRTPFPFLNLPDILLSKDTPLVVHHHSSCSHSILMLCTTSHLSFT